MEGPIGKIKHLALGSQCWEAGHALWVPKLLSDPCSGQSQATVGRQRGLASPSGPTRALMWDHAANTPPREQDFIAFLNPTTQESEETPEISQIQIPKHRFSPWGTSFFHSDSGPQAPARAGIRMPSNKPKGSVCS